MDEKQGGWGEYRMKRFNVAIGTNVCNNSNCDCCANSELRHTDKDGLCLKIQSVGDGLPLRYVGEWANDKIYYLLQYFQIFTQGMSKKWGKLRYVAQLSHNFVERAISECS